MKHTHLLKTALAAAAFLALASPAFGQRIDLDFSNHVEATDGSFGSLGASYSGNTMHFTNVATLNGQAIDAVVNITPFGDGVSFNGTFPDYNDGDLGFLFTAGQNGVAGVEYNISFTAGGSNFTQAVILPEVELMTYDVDGEPVQTETVIVDEADGFHSYAVGNNAASLTPAYLGDGKWQFTGPGQNYSETDTSGAALLTFRDTDSITLRFESTTTNHENTGDNLVFSAIDGNAQLPAGFGAAVSLPEPSSALTMAILAIATVTARRRDSKRLADLEA